MFLLASNFVGAQLRVRVGDHDSFVGIGKPDSDQPEKQNQYGQETQEIKRTGFLHESREEMLPREEDRRRGDELRVAHPPQMPHQTLCTRDSSAYQHANVASGSEQGEAAKEKVQAGGISIFESSRAIRRRQAVNRFRDSDT